MSGPGNPLCRIAALFSICVGGVAAPVLHAQESDPRGAVTLVATPQFTDPDYRATVLLAVPIENGQHVGVIINRPTDRSLASLFPEHAPSKRVRDPVYFGGPMLRQAKYTGSRTSLEGACSGNRFANERTVGRLIMTPTCRSFSIGTTSSTLAR